MCFVIVLVIIFMIFLLGLIKKVVGIGDMLYVFSICWLVLSVIGKLMLYVFIKLCIVIFDLLIFIVIIFILRFLKYLYWFFI